MCLQHHKLVSGSHIKPTVLHVYHHCLAHQMPCPTLLIRTQGTVYKHGIHHTAFNLGKQREYRRREQCGSPGTSTPDYSRTLSQPDEPPCRHH